MLATFVGLQSSRFVFWTPPRREGMKCQLRWSSIIFSILPGLVLPQRSHTVAGSVEKFRSAWQLVLLSMRLLIIVISEDPKSNMPQLKLKIWQSWYRPPVESPAWGPEKNDVLRVHPKGMIVVLTGERQWGRSRRVSDTMYYRSRALELYIGQGKNCWQYGKPACTHVLGKRWPNVIRIGKYQETRDGTYYRTLPRKCCRYRMRMGQKNENNDGMELTWDNTRATMTSQNRNGDGTRRKGTERSQGAVTDLQIYLVSYIRGPVRTRAWYTRLRVNLRRVGTSSEPALTTIVQCMRCHPKSLDYFCLVILQTDLGHGELSSPPPPTPQVPALFFEWCGEVGAKQRWKFWQC